METSAPYTTQPPTEPYRPPSEIALSAIVETGLLAAKLYDSLSELCARPAQHPAPADASAWLALAGDMHRASQRAIVALAEVLTDEMCNPPTATPEASAESDSATRPTQEDATQ